MYSALFLTETLTLVAGIFLCAPLIKRFGKRNIALAGSAIALVGQLLFFLNPYSFSWMVMSCVARAIAFAGYVTSSSGVATQSQETLNMIINIYKVGPIIIALLAFVTLALYKLDKMYPDIMKELTEREARGEL